MGIALKGVLIAGAIVALAAVLHFALSAILRPAYFVRFCEDLDRYRGFDSFSIKPKAYYGFVMIGAFALGFGAIKQLLFWMPDSWGSVEDGLFQPVKDTIAATAGGFLSLGLLSYLQRSAESILHLEELQAKVKELEQQLKSRASHEQNSRS